ncbi:multiheme c-type cytochrome [Candidatus Methanoperedens nitratireducens]|uniref:Cytochrome c-552/4 domain-containing protein n=1 Tax=Candidatus Methanoperedens nitratireducens TaxID=1392998 RepID=A0A284VS42_9EURY|nr:multiheme c-type cytochrome [Candidatus Methanoperedens nitroreducens]SNQ62028.1 exported hypothetical protein [Candidatus Methanoperedens nitroreducens]
MSVKMIIGAVVGIIAIGLISGAQAVEEFQISYSCTDCHPDRYEEWGRSIHALAVSDPVFEAAYMRALKSDPKYREYCLGCHSPITKVTKDFNLTKSISVEGVTCSFCHSVTGVEGNDYALNTGNLMVGPYTDSMTDAHTSIYSQMLTTSEFCSGCHELSINGVPVFETYSEWKEGPYSAEGKQCQDCHMEAKRGVAAKNGTLREKVYQHFWYGSHSGQFLAKAFRIESNIQQTGSRVKVTLNITNNNVGHKIPSGIPSRKVILDFKATDENGKSLFSAQKVYTKTLVDQYGDEVYDFWKAASVASDNRIKPRENRIEVFEFEIQDGINKLETHATLTYQNEAEIITRSVESMSAEIASNGTTTWFNQTAAPGNTAPKESPALGGIGSVVALIAIYLVRKKNG